MLYGGRVRRLIPVVQATMFGRAGKGGLLFHTEKSLNSSPDVAARCLLAARRAP
jgi:hypothetical protein